jgi:hypothetical protein
MPPEQQYMRNWNRRLHGVGAGQGLRRDNDPVVIHIYSEFLQRFRLAAQGKASGRQPPEHLRERVDLLRPAAVLVRAAGRPGTDHRYPLATR